MNMMFSGLMSWAVLPAGEAEAKAFSKALGPKLNATACHGGQCLCRVHTVTHWPAVGSPLQPSARPAGVSRH